MFTTYLSPRKSALWVADIDGRNKLEIASGSGALSSGSWAPDNLHLSFFDINSTAPKAYIVGADGSGLREVPPMSGTSFSPVWSRDQKSLYVGSQDVGASTATVWKWTLSSSNLEKIADHCGYLTDADPSGQYLIGAIPQGENNGIYQVSISDRKCTYLLPGALTFSATFARDGKSFLYAVASGGEVTIYRQPWKDGKIVGASQIALKIPFVFPLNYKGNAYDFSGIFLRSCMRGRVGMRICIF